MKRDSTNPVHTDATRRAALDRVLSSARTTLRTKAPSELVNEGIDLMFDAGIVATCRRCHISWRVSRSRFQDLEWWSCPSNCNRAPSAR